MRHGRLEWLEPDGLDERQRALYDAVLAGPRASSRRAFPMTDDQGRFHGPFNAMLFEPAVADPVQQLGAAVRYRSTLDDRCRELAILVVASLRRSNFEQYSHAALGRGAGLSDDEVEAIASGACAPTLSEAESLVREVVDSLVTVADLDDDLYERAVSRLGTPALVDLVYLVGFYELTALSLQVFRVPLPADVAPRFPREAGGRS